MVATAVLLLLQVYPVVGVALYVTTAPIHEFKAPDATPITGVWYAAIAFVTTVVPQVFVTE
jgi:hypothetical protein